METALPRILFLQNSSIKDRFGGIEYYLHDLLSVAATLDSSRVAAVIPDKEESKREVEFSYPTTLVPLGGRGWSKKIENRLSPRYLKYASQKIRSFAPDFLCCTHVSLGPLTYLLSRYFKIPYVSLVYGIESWGNLLAVDEWALKHSFGVISISEWTKKILSDRGYDPTSIQIINPCLASDFETSQPRKAVSDDLKLLSVSRLDASEAYKGQDHVIEALSYIRQRHPSWNINYQIVGDGSDRSRLMNLVKDFDLEPWVEFRDPVKRRSELAELYSNASVFVMPSRFGYWNKRWRGEGFGIVYLEAGIFGVPSIAYRCGGATDAIEDGTTGILVSPDDKHALAKAIEGFYQYPSLSFIMGRRAHFRVKRHFTKANVAEQFTKAFQAFDRQLRDR